MKVNTVGVCNTNINWRQTVLYDNAVLYKKLKLTIILRFRRKCHLKTSNTYLLLPCSFVTIHYLYLRSNPAYFDLAWTKQIPWRLCKCWRLVGVPVFLIIHLATSHNCMGRQEACSQWLKYSIYLSRASPCNFRVWKLSLVCFSCLSITNFFVLPSSCHP